MLNLLLILGLGLLFIPHDGRTRVLLAFARPARDHDQGAPQHSAENQAASHTHSHCRSH